MNEDTGFCPQLYAFGLQHVGISIKAITPRNGLAIPGAISRLPTDLSPNPINMLDAANVCPLGRLKRMYGRGFVVMVV